LDGIALNVYFWMQTFEVEAVQLWVSKAHLAGDAGQPADHSPI